jgi:hypothetical protein
VLLILAFSVDVSRIRHGTTMSAFTFFDGSLLAAPAPADVERQRGDYVCPGNEIAVQSEAGFLK